MLRVYTLDQSEKWDSIVRSFINYDVYWLSGYVKAFHIHGDGDPLLFFYDDGLTRGINVAMLRDVAKEECFKEIIPEGEYFDISSPYGYGGWIIEGKETQTLFTTYEHWMRDNCIISEFVRFHPLIKNHEQCLEFYDVLKLGEVVHMDLSSPEGIWSNITSKNRNMIRKALKNDVRIYNGRFPLIYEQFREIYNKTMDRDNAHEYYYFKPEFYESILDDIPRNSQVFWAEKDKQIIAASIMLCANKRMNYHLSGSLREFSPLAPGNLIIYEAAMWGCSNGYNTLFLGGGVGSGEDSLLKFKRSFYKGDLNHFFIGRKTYDNAKYDRLVNMRKISNTGFFPKYRA